MGAFGSSSLGARAFHDRVVHHPTASYRRTVDALDPGRAPLHRARIGRCSWRTVVTFGLITKNCAGGSTPVEAARNHPSGRVVAHRRWALRADVED